MSESFLYDLANGGLVHIHEQHRQTLEEVQREGWTIYNDTSLSMKYRLAALKLIQETVMSKEKLVAESESVMAVNAMGERLARIERNVREQQLQQEQQQKTLR
jgi:hypothetical protein